MLCRRIQTRPASRPGKGEQKMRGGEGAGRVVDRQVREGALLGRAPK